MADSASQLGAALGRLVGLVVDAGLSHHESHTGRITPGVLLRPADELPHIVVTPGLRCSTPWTGNPGEIKVTYDAANLTTLGPPPMHPMPAGEDMSNAAQHGVATPNPVAGVGAGVVVAIDPQLPRALYIGRLCPVTGGTPDVPVLIYLDRVP